MGRHTNNIECPSDYTLPWEGAGVEGRVGVVFLANN